MATPATHEVTGADALRRRARPSEPELAQLAWVALPVLRHLDVQLEIDLGAEQRLDLAAGGGADLLEPGTALADDDALLAGPLHVEDRVHVEHVGATLVRDHLLDQHRQ